MRKRYYYKVLKLAKKKKRQEQSTITKTDKTYHPVPNEEIIHLLPPPAGLFYFSPLHVRLDKRPAEYIILFRGLGGLALAPVRIHLVR